MMIVPTSCRGAALRFCLIASILLTTVAQADILVWDINSGAGGPQDGAGTWSVAGGNWFNQTLATQNQAWINGNDAVFGSNDGAAGTVSISGPITVGNLTFNAASSGTYTLGGSGTLALSNSTLTNAAAASISAVIVGTTSWVKEGAAQLTLSGATSNTASGTLSVNAGRLHLSKTGGATALAGDVTIGTGGSVTFSGGANQISPPANVVLNGASSGFNGTAPNTNAVAVTQSLASLTVSGGTFNSGGNGVWDIGAVSFIAGENKTFVGNSGSKQTYGSLSLTGMNGANSSTAVANGFTIFGNGSPSTNRTSLTIGSGGLSLDDSRIHLSGGTSGCLLILDGDVSTSGTATSYITRIAGGALQPFIHLGSTAGVVARTFDVADGGANLDIAPIIADGAATSGAIIKEGAGTLLFTGTEANTFTGGVTVNAGTLRLNKTAGVDAVSSDIFVNTGGILQLSTSNQIADTAGITLNGGSMTAWSTDETIASFTQNAGGLTSSGNIGHVTVTGALTLAGGNLLVINSNPGSANPASWDVGSAVLSGADILIGGSNGALNPRTTLTIGAGGLTMLGRTITMNVGDAGVQLNLNGDFTGTGTNNIVTNSTSSQQPLLEIGAASRTFNVLSGTTNVGVIISGTGGNLVKAGSGLLQLTNASTYSGTTTVSGGTISLISSGGLTSTTGIIVDNGGTFQNGNSNAAGNDSVTNRVNTAATLAMGGGTFRQMTAAVGAHTQELQSVTISGGANTVNATATAGTTATLTFTGANPYAHTSGTVNFVQNPVDGGSINFTIAPSGAGNISGGVLVGATLNGSDLIIAQSGVLTAYTGWIPTGTSTWTNGGNMDVTDSNPVAFTSETINALRFNTGGAFTTTLTGTHTIDSGMLLTTPNVGANLSTLTGGQIQGPAGGELIISQFNTAGDLAIGSNIVDNTTASGLIKTGGGTVELTGTNTYTGTTLVNQGVLRAADGVGLPSGSNLVLDGGAFQSTAATFTRPLGLGAGQVSLSGGTSGFSAASIPLAVNLGGSGAQVQWGSSFFDPSFLLLNASSATAGLDFQNALDLNGANRTVRVDANTATISGLISGSGAGIVKTGAGVLRLTQANTFDGGTTVSSGTIGIGDNDALGSGDITMSGGALQADGGARSVANDLIFASTSTLTGSNPSTLTLTGVISGTGTVNKSGSAVVELAGDNTYTGATSVSNGILRLLSNTALGSTSGATSVAGAAHVELADRVVITGETITINTTGGGTGIGSPTTNRGGLQAGVGATAEWAGNVVIGANQGRIGVQEGGTLTVSGDITDGANSFDVRLSGEMTGTGGLYIAGTGNAWDGQTEIVRGKVFLGADNALPTGTVLDIHFTGSNGTEYAGVDLNGFNQTIASLRNEGNTPNYAELTNGSCIPSMLTVNETGTVTYGGMINGNVALVKAGAGTMTLTRANLFTGGTTVNEGTLQIGNSAALGSGDLTVNGGAISAGKLNLNNISLATNALNGSAGTVSAIIANESATAATRTLTVGTNHGSGAYAGQIVDNTGGAAAGSVALTKIGSGSQTLSGTNNYSGDTLLSNGTLVADYTSGAPLSASSLIKMQGGALVISNATSASINAITQVQGGADFTTGSIRIENGATVTVGTFTGVGYTPFLIDVTGGGTLVATTLSGMGNTNGVLLGTASNRATTFVQDDTGIGFATYNGSSELVRYTSATTLTASNTSSTTNFIASADISRSASLSFHTLQLDTSLNDVTLDLGSGNLAVGSTGRSVLISGINDATITSTTGAVTGGSFYINNHSTGAATLDLSLSAQTVIASGPGLIEYTRTANPADLYVAGSVFRMTGGTRDYSNNLVRIYGGGVLEIGSDLNDAADGDFTRPLGSAAGLVAMIGNGGFSAYGADRVVALGGVAAPTALTWGASSFLSGPGGDNNYTLKLGSAHSTHTLEFQNNINLGSRTRRIEVTDGTSSTNVDGRMTGTLSGTGGLIKEGSGRLELTAANTYTGSTQVKTGSLLIASGGRTGSGAISVDANATLMGSGTIAGQCVTLSPNASLHAGDGTGTSDIGTLTFQTSSKAMYDFAGNSSVVLDIQTATNQSSIDPTFGGNSIGSPGYDAYVDALIGVGSGSHDLLTFDATAGSTLAFSSDLTVRPDGFTAMMGQIFNLIDWTALIGTDFSNFDVGTNFRTGAGDDLSQLDLPELSDGLVWDVSRFTATGAVVVVPEPRRAILLLLGILPILFRRRR